MSVKDLILAGAFGGKKGSGGGVTSWNDLTDRPFYSEAVEILPEITVECVEVDENEDGVVDGRLGEIPYVELTNGVEYTVTYNGVEYVCPCNVGETEETIDIALGNLGAVDESYPNTGEPFLALWGGTKGEGFSTGVLVSFAGSTSVTLSIAKEAVTKIPEKYIPQTAFPYIIELSGTGSDANPYVCIDMVEEVEAAISSGRMVMLKYGESNGDLFAHHYLPLILHHRTAIDGDYTYGAALTFNSYINSTTKTGKTLVPQENGSYKVLDAT